MKKSKKMTHNTRKNMTNLFLLMNWIYRAKFFNPNEPKKENQRVDDYLKSYIVVKV